MGYKLSLCHEWGISQNLPKLKVQYTQSIDYHCIKNGYSSKSPKKKSSNGKPIGTPHVQATPHVSRFLSYKIHSSSKASFILNTPSSQLSPIDPRCELLKLSLSFFCFRPSVCFSRKSINQEFSFSLSLRAKKKKQNVIDKTCNTSLDSFEIGLFFYAFIFLRSDTIPQNYWILAILGFQNSRFFFERI